MKADADAAGFMLDGAEGVEGAEEVMLAKSCAQEDLDEKAELTICQDFGLVA